MSILNKKTILFFSLSTCMITGCVAKNELKINSPQKLVVAYKSENIKPIWGKVKASTLKKKSIKKEDCLDCYATPIDAVKVSVPNRTYKKTTPIQTEYYGEYGYTEKASDTIVNKNNYVNVNKFIAPTVSYINSAYNSYNIYSKKSATAIQVGAFRRYSGAKVYMKRYNALSSKYKVTIKTGTKNNKPLHRVRIEGFANKLEAKNFMYSYGIKDAFVVRK